MLHQKYLAQEVQKVTYLAARFKILCRWFKIPCSAGWHRRNFLFRPPTDTALAPWPRGHDDLPTSRSPPRDGTLYGATIAHNTLREDMEVSQHPR